MIKGEKFNLKNLRIIRPSFELKPEYFYKVIGKKAKKDLKSGTPLSKNVIKNF